MVAERGVWSLSELVARARQGSPVTLFCLPCRRYCSLMLAERGN
ncbi:hypothetical protein A2U01_0119168 [Trifolium medium]|uniref:Uncharacterized protein n=1 Tax=Trifolium medium TaxID=97028 RepID=A0A392WBR4_9FABA|nr:hypothetical protein [Trifolium medium]